MSVRGLIRDLDEKQRKEIVGEIVGGIRIAKRAWDTVVTNGILSKDDGDVRRCLFDKCIGHLPFLVNDLLENGKKEEGASEKQKKYFLDLCKDKKAEEIAKIVMENAGIEKVEMSRIINVLKGEAAGGKKK
jgi:hypothetical protein